MGVDILLQTPLRPLRIRYPIFRAAMSYMVHAELAARRANGGLTPARR